MAWELNHSVYYRGNETDRMWFQRQESYLGVLSTHTEE